MAFLDAVADAERYTAAVDSLTERQAARTDEAAEEIREAFKGFKPVPFVRTVSLGGPAKLAYMPFPEAVEDALGYEEVQKIFIDMLKTSECVKVKALICAITNRHVRMWADEVGEVLA